MAQGLNTRGFSGASLAQARAVCVLIHGRGQTPAYMQQAVADPLALDGITYVLPASDGAGWYDARAVDRITDITLAQMNERFDQIEGQISDITKAHPELPVLIAGFSQGACLLVELLLRRAPKVAGAAAFTGCRIGTPDDDRPSRSLAGLPVYASCSDNDPWIPQNAFFDMLGTLTGVGARLRADLFPGREHEVCRVEITILRTMLADVIAGNPPFSEAT